MPLKNETNLELVNPATGKVFRTLKCDQPSDIERKFKMLKKYSSEWARVPFSKKSAAIQKFSKLLIHHQERLAKILSQEMGKPLSQSRGEIRATLGRIDFFLKQTPKELKEVRWSAKEKISFDPLGTVLNISAWNYPYFVGSNVFIPALLTGNTVCYKPSEFAAITGREIVKLLHQSGIPKKALALVTGAGGVGAKLLELPFDGVFFTGSYSTGVQVAKSAAPHLSKVQLELGGKDPIYVSNDLSPKKLDAAAASLVDGAFYNAGQSCCAVERIYVHEKVYDRFVEKFLDGARALKIGNPMKAGVDVGPLTRKPQLKVLEKQISDAVSKGARVLLGGRRMKGPGYFFEPTVLVNVSHKMDLMREESFGPIIGIQKVKSEKEAISLMNDTEYGLTAGVFCSSRSRAEKLMSQLNAGSVYWNCCDRVNPKLPWSGRGHSGLGSTLSSVGIQTFLQPKGWHLG